LNRRKACGRWRRRRVVRARPHAQRALPLSQADWDAIGSVVAAVPVPVVGNGDILFPQDVTSARARSGAAGVMSARGVLIKPWLFREVNDGYRDLTADERVAIYRRYVTLAREHWGADAHGLERVRQFTRWHIDFWHRYRAATRRRQLSEPPGARGPTSPRDAARRVSRANG
jgi:tRNA-dihydrouridine synthase